MAIQYKSPLPTKGTEPSRNVIKGGYQEVSPSPPPDPNPPNTWGTAVPNNTIPVSGKGDISEANKPTKDR